MANWQIQLLIQIKFDMDRNLESVIHFTHVRGCLGGFSPVTGLVNLDSTRHGEYIYRFFPVFLNEHLPHRLLFELRAQRNRAKQVYEKSAAEKRGTINVVAIKYSR